MPDPYIIYHDGYYYGLATEAVCVKLFRSKRVEKLFISGQSKTLIKAGDKTGDGTVIGGNIWAPELHYVPSKGKWYIYACGSINSNEFGSIRMFCLESDDGDPFGNYTFKGVMLQDKLCIDQTVYCDEDSGRLYTAYCEFTDKGQVIMLSAMREPWQIAGNNVMVSYPQYEWEKRGADSTHDSRVNEGPVFLKHNGKIFLIYSASGCWSEWYSLGILEYVGEDTERKNFLNADNWIKSSEPVFEKANEVYGVGHCSFFTSPDGSEVWISYHGMAWPEAGELNRFAYIQKIGFDENGRPLLGEPLSRDTKINVPSGEE